MNPINENLIKQCAEADLRLLGYTGIAFEKITRISLLWDIEFYATFQDHRHHFMGKVYQSDSGIPHVEPNSIRSVKRYS